MQHKNKLVKRLLQVVGSVVVSGAIIAILMYVTQGRALPVLQPAGTIAYQQYILILVSVGLGVFVVLPVFILLFTIAWKYREGNTKAQYDPELHGNLKLEFLWWGVPALIIIVLAIITAISTHALDPYKPLESDKAPLKVQVIALEWKWLFIYPDQGIATVNYLNIPEKTPVELSITADAPMNSFWVPSLAGQVYAMTGMSTKLHFMADAPGTYNGSSANLSGDGFAGMRFKVNAMNQDGFNNWVRKSMDSTDWLTAASYDELEKPSKDTPEKTYGLVQGSLYDDVIMKYMGSMDSSTHATAGAH
jgi:cytochrome o ubiquinol oxidase subunit 2